MNEHDLTTTDGIIAYLEEITGISLKTEYDGLPVDVALVKALQDTGLHYGIWFDRVTARIRASLIICPDTRNAIHGYGQTFRDAAIGALSAYEQWRSNV